MRDPGQGDATNSSADRKHSGQRPDQSAHPSKRPPELRSSCRRLSHTPMVPDEVGARWRHINALWIQLNPQAGWAHRAMPLCVKAGFTGAQGQPPGLAFRRVRE
jgi:hypothetical protein